MHTIRANYYLLLLLMKPWFLPLVILIVLQPLFAARVRETFDYCAGINILDIKTGTYYLLLEKKMTPSSSFGILAMIQPDDGADSIQNSTYGGGAFYRKYSNSFFLELHLLGGYTEEKAGASPLNRRFVAEPALGIGYKLMLRHFYFEPLFELAPVVYLDTFKTGKEWTSFLFIAGLVF